ncbi:hypothetical protein Pla144_22740 [Bythopirellula polymerisocia]|uniref:Uncharacterized protein n=1 Tax=Bythopirellula polymerisocia TaxID=2528003 RepID=A0A5C6CSH3_9BACT|nr:hypothetical protein Pla144_22740 [Bythopirellula polymerisocia]
MLDSKFVTPHPKKEKSTADAKISFSLPNTIPQGSLDSARKGNRMFVPLAILVVVGVIGAIGVGGYLLIRTVTRKHSQ